MVCLIAVLVGSLAKLSLYFCRFDHGISVVWPANALPLALLLGQHPHGWRRTSVIIAASMLGMITAASESGLNPTAAIQLGFANSVEIGGGAAVAWLPIGPRPRLRRLDGLLKLIVAIGVVGPALGALLGTFNGLAGWSSHFIAAGRLWFAAHALGNLIFTTSAIIVLKSSRTPLRVPTTPLSATLALAICLVLFSAVFLQGSVTGLFLIPPLFAFLGMVAGLEICGAGVTALTIFALYRTAMGHGPIVTLEPYSITTRIMVLQSLICASFLSAIPIALVLERRTRMIARLRRQKAALIARAADYRGLADSAADTLLVTLQDGTIVYASSAAERLIGIARSALTGRSAFDLVHPNDRKAVRAAMATLGNDTREVTAELRLQPHRDTSPIWAEVKTRIGEQRSGRSVELVSVVRDISARRAEDDRRKAELVRLDLLANTDTLTSLANRRRFNNHLEQEWRRATREQLKIALILIDVDLFKAYNDSYGHPAGDIALRRLASVVARGVKRPGDLAARIGGEEFAVILPSTFLSGARAVAERIRDGVSDMQLIHEKSPSGYLSVSIGIDCICPNPQTSPQLFMERADQALYRAKTRRGSIMIAT